MSNPKTTILGYLAIIAALAKILTDLLSGNGFSASDVNTLLVGLAGAGLVAARDGGH